MELNEVVSRFHLDLIPEQWVKSVWKDDFSTPSELPDEYELQLEDADYVGLMNELTEAIKNWLNDGNTLDRSYSFCENDNRKSIKSSLRVKKTWQTLLAAIDHKALLCFISTFLEQDARNFKDLQSMLEALSATKLYLALLNINGAHVYKVFNSILYSQAVETLKVANVLCQQSKQLPKLSSGGRKKGNKSTRNEAGDDNECIEDEVLSLSKRDMQQLLDSLSSVLEDLNACLKLFYLKSEEDSLVQTIQALIVLTRLERTTSQFLHTRPQHGSLKYLAYSAYELLIHLCDSNHGNPEGTIRLIMISVLPVLSDSDQPVLHVTARESSIIKEHTVSFIKKISNEFPTASFVGIKSLLQQMCVRIPDKADIRAKCVQNIAEMLGQLSYELFTSFVTWVVSLCHTEKVRHRMTGIELLTKLLSVDERSLPDASTVYESRDNISNEHENYTESVDFSSHPFLLAAILSRCHDVSSTVRAKALSALVSMISSRNFNGRHIMEQLFISNYSHVQVIESSPDDKGFFDFKAFISKKSKKNAANIDPLPSGMAIVQLLEKFAEDEKVFVRKNALHALCSIYRLNVKWATEKRLKLLVASCKDVSVAVRKMLTQCMTDLLLEYPIHNALLKCWVQGIIPLIGDNEIKSQEKVLEAIENVILNNMVHYDDKCEVLHSLPWNILSLISSLGMRQLFRFACKQWTLKNRFKNGLYSILQSHIGTENNLPAWFLLVCISEFQNVPNPKFILDYYYNNIYNAKIADEYCSQLVLEAVRLNWRELGRSLQEDLCLKLKESIQTFSIPLSLIAGSIEICQLQDPENNKSWGGKLISACESYLKKTVAPGCNKRLANEHVLSQYIFTLGELTQFCPGVIQKNTIHLLAKLVDSDYDDGGTEKWEGTVSDCVRAITVSTLGKLALQDQFTAKSLVPSFGNLLSNQCQPSVKINATIALSDLCIRFTGLIEAYLGDMFVCLRDPNLIVRTNTLTLLIQLIQEDYLKLRCPFFFYILFMLEDETSSIREQTAAFLINTVMSKNPSIMYQYFLQSLFFYNDYEEHASYSKVAMSPQERAAFCIPGESKRDCRHKLYRYMLDHMQDDHRFKVTYRLCTEVLDEVCEGKIQLDEVGTFVLQDALYILACDEIRMMHLRSGREAQEDDNGEMMEEVITHVRKTIISQLIKKNYVENIVPIIIRLKHKLKEMKSPLVRDIMICLRELMKDFKEEIDEILAADPELASEVALDLRLMEEEEAPQVRDEEYERRQQIKSIMKEARIECVRLSEEVLLRGSINLGCPPEGFDFDLAGLTSFTSSPTPNTSTPPRNCTTPNTSTPPRNFTTPNTSTPPRNCTTPKSTSSKRKRTRRSSNQK